MYEPPNAVREYIENYRSNIVPLIDRRDYEQALLALSSANFIFSGRSGEELIRLTHFGYSIALTAKLLENKLDKGDDNEVKRVRRVFETLIGQTWVPGRDTEP